MSTAGADYPRSETVSTMLEGGQRRRLQLAQGLQWLRAAGGDPFAALLRDHDEDHADLYARLHGGAPIWRSTTGTWVVARHRAAMALAADPAVEEQFVDWRPLGIPVMPLTAHHLGLHPEGRESLLGLARAELGEEALVGWQPQWAAAVRRRLDRAGEGGKIDLAALAADLAVDMLAAQLALPEQDRSRLAEQAPRAGLAADSLLCPQDLRRTRDMLAGIADLRDLFKEQPLHLILAVLGVRVCSDLLRNALAALLANPAGWAALRAEPGSAAAVLGETLRHDPPVRVQMLVAAADTDTHSVPIATGDQIAVLLGVANRDPEVFPDPDVFRPDRVVSPDQPVLLPGWPVGSVLPLVRAQAVVALTALADRFPDLAAAGPVVRDVRAPATRAVRELPAWTDRRVSRL
ncbi:cytochrome P450 family protein [Micromonospora sp. DT229]|uniref:cytochrome P450 family protein n=1 Tax=Micromonospora sp. DT229 TaxID=3393430 RepID=UPI003CF02C7D